tara:strand:+ start:43 stop:183 length:141 start_codon:yes stop_codon:yes gene_type:complete
MSLIKKIITIFLFFLIWIFGNKKISKEKKESYWQKKKKSSGSYNSY